MAKTLAAAAKATRFDNTWRRFRVRVASTPEEVQVALDLRHEIFHLEMLGRPAPGGSDLDQFDTTCDQLLITDAVTDEPMGTCRMNCSRVTDVFYTATEFELQPFLGWDGVKVEMGRTCFRKAHRNNLTIAALGRALSAYCEAVEARFLFGCSSVNSTDPATVAKVSRYFAASGHTLPDEVVAPRADHRLDRLDAELAKLDPDMMDEDTVHGLLPPLLRGYLRAGAKVSRLPSHDPDFGCVDYFTVLDLDDNNDAFVGRYMTR